MARRPLMPPVVRGWGRLAVEVVLLLFGAGLFQMVADRTNRRFDLTPTRDLSLSPVTEHVLRELAAPLHVTVFYRRGTREQYADMLARFRAVSPRVEFELLDLDRFPERARSDGVTQYGRAALEYDGRRAVALAAPEEELAGGILRVVRGRARRLVFTTGHGERTPGAGERAYGRFAAALGAENYAVDGVSLFASPIPPDTDVLVVAGPTQDFVPTEAEAVARYVVAGGGVLLLLDPGPLPTLSRLLGSMGIRLGDDFLVDHERRVLATDGLAAVVELFKEGNPVSGPLDSGVVLPSARSVDVVEAVAGVDADSIARTAPTAWAIADPARARAGDAPSAAKRDQRGSTSVAVIAEIGSGTSARGRLVVVGDADFASDAYFELLGNRDLALNAVAWAAREDLLTGARKKNVPETIRPLSPLFLTERQAQTLFVSSVLVAPGLVALAGAAMLAARRRHG